jgi:WD40 repeat protein
MTPQDVVEPPAEAAPPPPAGSLARVFVSYAREDLDFVREMCDLLEVDGRNVWVDLDEIPSSAEWASEIDGGIDAADVVIVVLSPDWVGSGPCNAELDRAVAGGKRLLPMLRRDVDPDSVRPEIGSLQWLPCQDGIAAEDVVAALTETLDMDLEWVKAHTRLLVKALEWENNHQDRALLLRGGDLVSAETALAAHGDDHPAPTVLQRSYVVASRESAVRSARIRFGAVTVALVVSIGLTVVAFFERSEAQHQTTIATVRALSASSVAEQSRDPELSLLLALEAVKRSDTGESERALRQALEDSQLEATFRLKTPFQDAAFSPTGRELVFASTDGVRVKPDWTDLHTDEKFLKTGPVYGIGWSADGTKFVTAGGDGKARIFDARSNEQQLVIDAHLYGVTSAVLSPDGSRVLTTGIDDQFQASTARVWDATTGAQLAVLQGTRASGTTFSSTAFSSAAFSPDGQRLVTASLDGTARIWDATTGAQQLVIRAGHGDPAYVFSASFSPDGAHIVTGEQKDASIWDATDGHLVRDLVGHVSGVIYSARYNATGDRIITAGSDSTARVWDVGTGDLLTTLYGHTDQVNRASFSSDGSLVVTASADGTVRIWKATPNGDTLQSFPSDGVRVSSAGLSPNGKQVVTGRFDGTARLWNADPTADAGAARRPTTLTGATGPVFWATFSPDGKRIASSSIDGSVRLWDARTGAQQLQLPIQPIALLYGTTSVVDFSPDGRYLAGASGPFVYVWDLQQDGKLVANWRPSSDGTYVIHKVVFSPDGKTVMTADHFGQAVLWDWRANGKVRRRIKADFGELFSADYSKDGTRIVTSGADGTAKVWNARTGKQLFVLRGHLGLVFDAGFSPDGTRIVTAGSDTTTRLWDAEHGGDALVVFHGHSDLIATAEFSQDGKQILTSSADGSARLFACDVCGSVHQLERLAKARVTRSLTADEKRRFGL